MIIKSFKQITEEYGNFKKGRIQPKTPGIHMDYQKVSASIYPRIVHSSSGLVLKSMSEHPLEYKLSDFVQKVDKHLSGIDWTRSPEKLRDDKNAVEKVKTLHGLQRK